ncbi:hypothetical protein PYH37_000082 [Sinorhizobium numidicum]|uniref:Uncharacterized protein n=1 Tax=Sinorhizobium numidicum TaxID=680248 RepID=A0ABY8CRJ3_9HYPH|nr:hypothetical protein [Sinorhizobium numidicum]WEX74804.1 hypothetical protein PYH37_000082 [Sinorhizobium numidicum]WEX80797.1 hypothetical protein PYH38_000084 [Sinorhizobium numidicum]
MFRHSIAAGGAAVRLALAAALTTGGVAGSAEAASMKRTITMVAVEAKGGTTVDKEPFPSAALPEGKGYGLEAPNAEGRWEVSTYRWEPN